MLVDMAYGLNYSYQILKKTSSSDGYSDRRPLSLEARSNHKHLELHKTSVKLQKRMRSLLAKLSGVIGFDG